MSKQLNPRQVKFVQSYLLLGDATRAAIEAGYSETTSKAVGLSLLKNPLVLKEMTVKCEKIAEQNEITLAEVVRNARKLVELGSTPRQISSRGGTKYDTHALSTGNDQLIRLAGLYAPDKLAVKHDLSDKSDAELRAELKAIRARTNVGILLPIDVEGVEVASDS